MKYKVDFKAEITGTAYIEAESTKDAYKQVRTSLEPAYKDILNDDLESHERYDINPVKVKS